MRALVWTLGIWTVALIIGRRNDFAIRNLRRSGWGAERIAIVLALLGSFTIAARTTTQQVLADPVVLERVVRAGLVGLGALVVAPAAVRRFRTTRLRSAPGLTLLWLYVVIAGLSTLYSVAPIVTGPKAIELAVGLMIITSLALSDSNISIIRQAVRFIIGLEASLVSAAVAGFFILPSTFSYIDYRPGFLFRATMSSPWASSNSLSAAGSVVAAYALASYFGSKDTKSKLVWMALFIVGTAGTVLASGRQGVAMWVVAVALLLLIHRRRLFFLLLGPAVVTLVVLNWEALLTVLQRNQSEQSLFLLTGRLRFWSAALSLVSEHLWTGFGFGAGGRFVALSSIGEGTRSNLHSGYLEALIGVGLLGIIPLLSAVAYGAWWAGRSLIKRVDTPVAILIVPLILHTFVDLGFGAWLKPDFLLLASIVALADTSRRAGRIDLPELPVPANPAVATHRQGAENHG